MSKENVHTLDDLRQLQALPLSVKVSMTKLRIRWWIDEFGEDGVYVAFSGGKDSTVLLDLVRKDFPNVPAIFVDTGLEYPQIRDFVKTFENVVWLKPKMNFKQVINKYGYPFISKEVSQTIHEVRRSKDSGRDYTKLANYQRLIGEYKFNGKKAFSREKYQFFIKDDAPRISNMCCNVMKKQPAHEYSRETGRKAIVGTLAAESILRRSNWIKYGCNAFGLKNPTSTPLSFWTEQDILQYIKENNLPICSVYGEIVSNYPEEMDGQMSFDDLGMTKNKPILKTTGCDRTGCMFCGYGCHLNNDQRFVLMKQTHPKQYEWIMKPVSEGGLGYKEVIDWINENGNLNIKY